MKKNLDKNIELMQQHPMFAESFELLMPYFKKPSLVEIRVNKPLEIVLEFDNGKKEFIKDTRLTLDFWITFGQTLAFTSGQVFNEKNPILSAKLTGGHRVQIMGYSTVESGFAMSVRINRFRKFKMADFGIDSNIEEEIIESINNHKTILVSGGTGTGKTSLTNVLLEHIPDNERIISIEGVQELQLDRFKDLVKSLYSENKTGSANITAENLLRTSLRMNPDRIIVGEIHTENAETFCSAINTGHEGSVGTIHANSPKEAIASIIMKIIMQGGSDSAIKVLQEELCRNIYAVIQITKNAKGQRKATFQKLSEFADDIAIKNLAKEGVNNDNI